MFEWMQWEEAYELWERESRLFPQSLSKELECEKVHVEYEGRSCIYGYDWLENDAAEAQKDLIKNNVTEFLYFSKPSNKGTIQTAQMLIEAKDPQERAAIWIAANGFELKNMGERNGLSKWADQFCFAAQSYLKERFFLWHHAMKRLVPEIIIPRGVISAIPEVDKRQTMQLIQMNTLLLQGTHRILLYSSLPENEVLEQHSLRRDALPF